MKAPAIRLVCKAGERVKGKLPRTISDQFFENERQDQRRTAGETALPILKLPVI